LYLVRGAEAYWSCCLPHRLQEFSKEVKQILNPSSRACTRTCHAHTFECLPMHPTHSHTCVALSAHHVHTHRDIQHPHSHPTLTYAHTLPLVIASGHATHVEVTPRSRVIPFSFPRLSPASPPVSFHFPLLREALRKDSEQSQDFRVQRNQGEFPGLYSIQIPNIPSVSLGKEKTPDKLWSGWI
jgi:hypothetical protein